MSKSRLHEVEWRFVGRTLSFLLITLFVGFTEVLFAQPTVPGPTPTMISSATSDPWFRIMFGYWVFSAVVSGMPEPEQDGSSLYLWAYRTGHILTGTGTSYFQNRHLWPTPPQSSITVDVTQKGADTRQ